MGEKRVAFAQLRPDGELLRFSSFQHRPGDLASCPAAADWLDAARAGGGRRGVRGGVRVTAMTIVRAVSAADPSRQKTAMHIRPALVSSLFLVLAGCGGGDKKAPVELVGKLQAGRIQGVEWRTPTRSGSTGADGSFTYLPGETVTFSLGGVELGAVPGSPDITLFTLAGLTPPTTERALRRQLDLAMRTSTPFTRAINLDLLFIALDADGNPDNGLDVRNRADALTRVSLDFDQRIGDFGYQLYANVPALNQSIPMFKPVAHLYTSLGLRVPVHAQMRIVTDGALGATGVQTFSYQSDGLIRTEDEDRDGDGTTDFHLGYGYDAFGRPTRFDWQQDFDLDDVIDQHYVTTRQYDAHGRILGLFEDIDNGARGPHQTWRLAEHVVDDFGRLTRQVEERDDGGDGSIDMRQVSTAEYDASRTRSVFVTTTDEGNDGVVDAISRSVEIDDAKRRPLSRIFEQDDGADGVVDSRDTYTYVYDDVARTMRAVSESDVNADGSADWRGITTWQLDRAGNVLMEKTAYEPFADGVVWQSQSTTREFDAQRRPTKSTRDEDFDGNGTADTRQHDSTSYDELGNVTWYVSDYDGDMDGRLDLHVDEGSEYGADGELIASATHYDFDGDGFTDVRSGLAVDNAVVDDGVLLLTNWYFRTRYSGFQ